LGSAWRLGVFGDGAARFRLRVGVGLGFTGVSERSLVGVSRRRRDLRTAEGVAGDIGGGEATDLELRLGAGLDGVEKSIWAAGEAAGVLDGEDLGLDLDLVGVADRSIPVARRRRGGRQANGKFESERRDRIDGVRVWHSCAATE
jgi:hypothetical protein